MNALAERETNTGERNAAIHKEWLRGQPIKDVAVLFNLSYRATWDIIQRGQKRAVLAAKHNKGV